MAGKPVDMPAVVELFRMSLCIRFTWNGQRCSRISEALALRREDVEWGHRQAHVLRTIALGEVEERTKTGKNRFVLLN